MNNKRLWGIRNNGGMSLIEILVAVAVLSLSIIAVVAVLRKGSEISITEIHARRARIIIDSCFESQSYHYSNYDKFVNFNGGVVIDERDRASTTDDLTGSIEIVVVPQKKLSKDGTTVPYKEVTITVGWNEPEQKQTVTFSKWITKI
jgi:type II secretory pathway pseudopilin PulG